MSHTDDEYEDLQNLSEMYHSTILDSTEAIGWGIEILTKVAAASYAGTLGSFSPADQNQAKQTLMYLKERKSQNDQLRKSGDPEPRTFEQFEHP
ncbi:hypothetical protein WKH49_08430 [Pantoea agglomerans]|uniref:hypothetical protein n=1 Tax=Enterobacter agglomerans TaxID=549 RepID=UPI00241319B1|nr:hypothetical protein [Pantoea agglomerans]